MSRTVELPDRGRREHRVYLDKDGNAVGVESVVESHGIVELRGRRVASATQTIVAIGGNRTETSESISEDTHKSLSDPKNPLRLRDLGKRPRTSDARETASGPRPG